MDKYITADADPDDLLLYWLSLYPELDEVNELTNILKQVSNVTIDKLLKQYRFENFKIKDSDFYFKNVKPNYKVDKVLVKIGGILKWVNFGIPILRYHFKDLYETIFKSTIISDKDIFLEKMIYSISAKMFRMIYKVIVLELKIAKKENLLEGNSKQERANYFDQKLLTNETYLKELYCVYPELVRAIDIHISNSVNYINEIIENTENEKRILERLFGDGEKLGSLSDIQLDQGDSHNGGKSVAKLVYDTGKIIVYKPRKLDLEQAYTNFLNWINNKKIYGTYPIESCRTYSVATGGWMKYVEFIPCLIEEEIRQFYARMGQLLCILYTFRANDFHHENLICQKDQPILIDLETILSQGRFKSSLEKRNAEQTATELMNESVCKVSLLPTKIVNCLYMGS